jgi:Type I phosphodiesterase / nucleotide pyrophosphatase
MCGAVFRSVPLFRARKWLATLVRLARRGSTASPVSPRRRRVVLLQVDGLSTRRFEEALARGDMPHLERLLAQRESRLVRLTAATPPSTPVFQAGLLYGDHGDVPGFGWFDRALGRAVRMDLAEDVVAIEESLSRAPERPPLLRDGVSYGTIWPAGAAHAFFNVVLFVHGATGRARVVRNAYDRLVSMLAGATIAGRVAGRFMLELGVGLFDFVRWCRRIHTTRFEWRFLYMRLAVSVVMRDLSTQGAIVDILRGVPIIYIDYLGYDEYAHRRGPDSQMALYNLRGIDAAIGRVLRAARAVPEYGYDVYVFSDHGQTATRPFEHVVGRDLHQFVLEHAARGAVGKPVDAESIRELVTIRENEVWVRSWSRPLRPLLALYLRWLRRRLERRLDGVDRASLGIRVVTGGTIAHLYFSDAAPDVDTIARAWPALLDALVNCPAIGLVLGRAPGGGGPVVFYRGRRYQLDDRRALERLEPFQRIGYELLAQHLRDAARSGRSGDLILYGAFSHVGDVTFDFEFGSHGGVGPEELDLFMLYPEHVDFPLRGAITAEALYRFFRARYAAHDHDDQRDAA